MKSEWAAGGFTIWQSVSFRESEDGEDALLNAPEISSGSTPRGLMAQIRSSSSTAEVLSGAAEVVSFGDFL